MCRVPACQRDQLTTVPWCWVHAHLTAHPQRGAVVLLAVGVVLATIMLTLGAAGLLDGSTR